MPTRYPEGAARSHGFGTSDRTCLEGIRKGLQERLTRYHDRSRKTRSYMPTKYSDGAARSDGFGTPDRTCLEGIRKGLQDLTGKEHQIVNAYEISGPGCRVSRDRDTRSNTARLQNLTGADQQIQHVYKVSDRDCRT